MTLTMALTIVAVLVVLALAAVEAFLGASSERTLDADTVREGFAATTSPGRLERVRATPTTFIDATHNPHGAQALAAALEAARGDPLSPGALVDDEEADDQDGEGDDGRERRAGRSPRPGPATTPQLEERDAGTDERASWVAGGMLALTPVLLIRDLRRTRPLTTSAILTITIQARIYVKI